MASERPTRSAGPSSSGVQPRVVDPDEIARPSFPLGVLLATVRGGHSVDGGDVATEGSGRKVQRGLFRIWSQIRDPIPSEPEEVPVTSTMSRSLFVLGWAI